MADRRRRRRSYSNTESECSEGEETTEVKKDPPIKKEAECDSEFTQGEETSEYDSTTEGYDEEETETEEDDDDETTEDIDDNDDDVIIEAGLNADWIEEERQRGDGEEEPNSGKNLDDDEDKKNPAYIPRKGAFYEHDTRLGDEVKEEKEPPVPKKKLWTDAGSWGHDRYSNDQQAPKSREEIIAIYGYDIRQREKPPDAFARGNKIRRQPDRRKQFGDYLPPRDGYQENEDYRDDRSHERPYRGRGGRGAPWRGGPRGRGPRPSRPPRSSYSQDNRNNTDYQNSRNNSDRFTGDIYEGDSVKPNTNNRHYSNKEQSPVRYEHGEPSNNSSMEPKPNPPDVVPTSHVDNSCRDEQSGDQIQVRTRFRQGTNRDNPGQNYDFKSEVGDHRTRGMRTRVQEYHPSDVEKLSQKVQHIAVPDNNYRVPQGAKTTSQDVRLMSIYPPVTAHTATPTSTTSGERIASPRSSDPNAARIPKPDHNVMPTGTTSHKTMSSSHTKPVDNSQGRAKQMDSTRTKRYSTQRQRLPQEMAGYIPEVTRDAAIAPHPGPNTIQRTQGPRPTQPAQAPRLVHSAQPPRPMQSSQSPRQTQPPRSAQSTQPPRPTMSSQPPRPTMSSQPPRPTMSSQPPRSTQPPRPTMSSQPPRPMMSSQPQRPTVSTQPPRPTLSSQPPRPTQSVQPHPPSQVPMPVLYSQLYARPAVFRQPVPPVSNQSPPHTMSFAQAPVIASPLQAVPFSIPVTSQVQSPPRLHMGPETTLATANITASVTPAGGQTLLPGPYVHAPVLNYVPPVAAPPQAAPSHYQMTGHVPVQFPAPAAPTPQATGPEPILIRGGTTYFSHEAQSFRTGTTYFSPEAQQPTPVRTIVTRRPVAAIPIINPQDLGAGDAHLFAEMYGDDVEYVEEYTEYVEPYTGADGMHQVVDENVQHAADERTQQLLEDNLISGVNEGNIQSIAVDNIKTVPEDHIQNATEDCTQNVAEDNMQSAAEHCIQSIAEDHIQSIAADPIQSVAEDHTQSLAEDPIQSVAEDHTQSIAEDRTQSIAEDRTQSVAEDHIQSIAEDNIQSIAEDHTQSVAEDHIQSVAEDNIQSIAEDHIQSVAEDNIQSIAEDRTQNVTDDGTQNIEDDNIQSVAENNKEHDKEENMCLLVEEHTNHDSNDDVQHTIENVEGAFTEDGMELLTADREGQITEDIDVASDSTQHISGSNLQHLDKDISCVIEDHSLGIAVDSAQHLAEDSSPIVAPEPSGHHTEILTLHSDEADEGTELSNTVVPDSEADLVQSTNYPTECPQQITASVVELNRGTKESDNLLETDVVEHQEECMQEISGENEQIEHEIHSSNVRDHTYDSIKVESSVDSELPEEDLAPAAMSNPEQDKLSEAVPVDAQLETESFDAGFSVSEMEKQSQSTVDSVAGLDSDSVSNIINTNVDLVEQSKKTSTSSQHVTNQGTEKIMTEIKFVYTEAKES